MLDCNAANCDPPIVNSGYLSYEAVDELMRFPRTLSISSQNLHLLCSQGQGSSG